MKKVLLSLSLLASICVGLSSCANGNYDATPSIDKSNIPNPLNLPPDNAGNAKISATVNGVAFVSTVGTATYPTGGFSITASSGISASFQSISITIPTFMGAGTYVCNTTANATYTLKNNVTASTFGQIIVDTASAAITEGRFSFQGTGLAVTNGTFRVLN
ncbi:MAG: hypothetical protein H0X33_01615 [Taibaiella sp.]|nr:hypothetical protein [Taibaiella sp.]